MKIGILTYHRADNYGAVLQAYALCQYLCEQGCDAGNIDYWPKHHAYVYKLWCWDKRAFLYHGVKGKALYILNYPWILFRNYKRIMNFKRFRKKTMKIISSKLNYDAVFYGSDTIWNRWNLNTLYTGFDPAYWGANIISTKHRFSYAPSMGNIIDDEQTRKHCKDYLELYDRISVREFYLKKKLEDWGFKNIYITVDPTMLLSKHWWKGLASHRIISDDYIVCYNLEQSQICREMAVRIGKERKLRVIQLTGQVSKDSSKDIFDTAGPYEFLSLIAYASYVVTSSFHGCVFSIIYNKLFCFHSDIETERISYLLDSCSLTDRFVTSPDTTSMYRPINYEKVNNLIEEKITASKQFIADCLKIVD